MTYTNVDGESVTISIMACSKWIQPLEMFIKLDREGKFQSEYDTLLNVSNNYARAHIGRLDVYKPTVAVMASLQRDSVGWRPVMKLSANTEKLKKENPNGSIVKGASLYVGSLVLDPVTHPYNSLPEDELKHGLFIGDTVLGKELEWVWWEGMCISTKVLVTGITLEQLRYIGLV